MVRPAVLCLCLLAPGLLLAQEAEDLPPIVATEAPALGDGADAIEAPLAVPSMSGQAAPETSVETLVPSAPAQPVETDLLSLVLKAHLVVQAVMALLAAAVFAVLTIYIFKTAEFALAFSRLSRDARALSAKPIQIPDSGGPLAQVMRAAEAEVQALPPRLTPDLRASARERLDLSLARIEATAVRQLRSGTGLLATIGSVAPFVGLFGTVFGIMNSFLAIADSGTTNLVVVAPGIAEALLATGIGLAAAIPAVMLYNRAMRRIAEFRHRLADGTAEALRRFSHALDARMGPEG